MARIGRNGRWGVKDDAGRVHMSGFLSKLFGGRNTHDAETVSGREVHLAFGEDLEVSGEAFHRNGIGKIFRTLGRAEGGVTMQTAQLIPDPKNTYDRNAVRVVVMGQQVGHVPREFSAQIARLCARVGRGNTATVLARIWARNDDGVWRSRVTLSFSGECEDERDYAAEHREAAAKYANAQAERERKTAEKEARRIAGSVDGQYWPLLKPSIAELKRQKRMEDARDLLEQCVYAAEREATVAGKVPDSWPSEQISVVLRRLRNYELELKFLERYVSACGDREVPESVASRVSRSRLAVERETPAQ